MNGENFLLFSIEKEGNVAHFLHNNILLYHTDVPTVLIAQVVVTHSQHAQQQWLFSQTRVGMTIKQRKLRKSII